jgi:hypothetical protein
VDTALLDKERHRPEARLAIMGGCIVFGSDPFRGAQDRDDIGHVLWPRLIVCRFCQHLLLLSANLATL